MYVKEVIVFPWGRPAPCCVALPHTSATHPPVAAVAEPSEPAHKKIKVIIKITVKIVITHKLVYFYIVIYICWCNGKCELMKLLFWALGTRKCLENKDDYPFY